MNFDNNDQKNQNTSLKKQNIEVFNFIINPYIEKIKLYKEHLKSKINLEKSILGFQNEFKFDEKNHLISFASGAVEYGLPCEVIYSRSLEVKIFILKYRMK